MNQNKAPNNKESAFADAYLRRSVPNEVFINDPPDKYLKYIVIIPAFIESGLIKSLDSLFKCDDIEEGIEVLIVVNSPWSTDEASLRFNLEIKEKAKSWAKDHNKIGMKFHFIHWDAIDPKNSGVGFARKAGMDEAVRRFNKIGKPDGIILSLDADVLVDKNYFRAVRTHIRENKGIDGFNIHFEHPLDGGFEEKVYEAIAQYELHLRYYVQALRYAGHPNTYHTLGSAFGVRADVYCKQGGMNKRQAGEDFYFLQKIFDLGNFSECNSTRVIPSPRPSNRVPFGTGPMVRDFLKEEKELKTNNPELFVILKDFLKHTSNFYEKTKNSDFNFINDLHPVLGEFLKMNNIEYKLTEIQNNSSSEEAFIKRFYRWFNMFRVLKFLNYSKNEFHDVPVKDAARILLMKGKFNLNFKAQTQTKDLLRFYREIQKDR